VSTSVAVSLAALVLAAVLLLLLLLLSCASRGWPRCGTPGRGAVTPAAEAYGTARDSVAVRLDARWRHFH
jgi:hypothetical protein